jgi:inner membrane protein
MPTIISHTAVALLRRAFGEIPPRAVFAGVLLTILPDGDTVGFYYGIPYNSTFGHRGFTHSILFALVMALLGTWVCRRRLVSGRTAGGTPAVPGRVFAFLFVCAMSHPLLDMLTNGGRGVALLSPFSNRRFFFPWRPIQVSPIARGVPLKVFASELKWIWLPCLVAAIALRIVLGGRARSREGAGS